MKLTGFTKWGKAELQDAAGRPWIGCPDDERVWIVGGTATADEKKEMEAFFASILDSVRDRNDKFFGHAAEERDAEKAEAEKAKAEKAAKIQRLKALKNPSFAERAELEDLKGGNSALLHALRDAAKADREGSIFLGGRWGHTVLVKGLHALDAATKAAFLEGTLRHKAQGSLAVRELAGCRASMRWTRDRRGRDLAILDMAGNGGVVETSTEKMEAGASLQTTSTGTSRVWVRVN